MFGNVSVIGLGLLGSSICIALREKNPKVRISAFGRDLSRLDQALRDGYVDSIGLIDDFDYSADLVVVSVPVVSSIEIIKKILNSGRLKSSALVVDVGSVKKYVVEGVSGCASASRFIGCHPMTGSEKSGYGSGRSDLYKGACVFITPAKFNDAADVGRIRLFWEYLGSSVLVISPEEHDRAIAYTSHIPHIIAASVVRMLQKNEKELFLSENVQKYIAGGFRDVTRISSGSPDMWRDIMAGNRENILKAIDRIADEVSDFKDILLNDKNGDAVYDYFSAAKKYRDSLS